MTNKKPSSQIGFILKIGIIFAIVAFIIGTIVAVIAGSNLGPLVGIIWGIDAFVIGLIIGVFISIFRQKINNKNLPKSIASVLTFTYAVTLFTVLVFKTHDAYLSNTIISSFVLGLPFNIIELPNVGTPYALTKYHLLNLFLVYGVGYFLGKIFQKIKVSSILLKALFVILVGLITTFFYINYSNTPEIQTEYFRLSDDYKEENYWFAPCRKYFEEELHPQINWRRKFMCISAPAKEEFSGNITEPIDMEWVDKKISEIDPNERLPQDVSEICRCRMEVLPDFSSFFK